MFCYKKGRTCHHTHQSHDSEAAKKNKNMHAFFFLCPFSFIDAMPLLAAKQNMLQF